VTNTPELHPQGPVFVLGDPHGVFDRTRDLLTGAGLIDQAGSWHGADAQLYCLGDLIDRGPDGAAVVELFIRLEQEAPAVGGVARCLLGNHEGFLLAARTFAGSGSAGIAFVQNWIMNGGRETDIRALTSERIAWLRSLRAIALVGEALLVHSDTTSYRRYGTDVGSINRGVSDVLHSHDVKRWQHLLIDLSERHDFDGRRPGGAERARGFLHAFGAQRLVHGHTPILSMRDSSVEDLTEPYRYADGLCINVDGALFQGGPGFLLRLDGSGVPQGS